MTNGATWKKRYMVKSRVYCYTPLLEGIISQIHLFVYTALMDSLKKTCFYLSLILFAFFFTTPVLAESSLPSFSLHHLQVEGEVLTSEVADFNGDGLKDIILFYKIEKDGQVKKKAGLFNFSSKGPLASKPQRVLSMPKEVSMVEAADVNGDKRDDLVTFQRGVVRAFLQKAQGGLATKSVEILRFASLLPDSEDDLITYGLTEDVNGDGLPDLILPSPEGYALFLQREGGTFDPRPSTTLSLPLDANVYQEDGQLTISQRMPRVLFMDFTGDGPKDALVLKANKGYLFPAHASELFNQAPQEHLFPIQEGPNEFLYSSVLDLNDDSLPDVVFTKFTQEKDFNTEVSLFLAQEGCSYEKEPTQVFKGKGQANMPIFLDLNGDGKKELVMEEINVGLSFFINYFLFSRLKATLTLRSMNSSGSYPQQPTLSKGLSIKIVDSGQLPLRGKGDFNGDGLEDYVVAPNPRRLSFLLGDKASLITSPMELPLEVDSYGLVKIVDINDDAITDLVIMYREKDRQDQAEVLLSKKGGGRKPF